MTKEVYHTCKFHDHRGRSVFKNVFSQLLCLMLGLCHTAHKWKWIIFLQSRQLENKVVIKKEASTIKLCFSVAMDWEVFEGGGGVKSRKIVKFSNKKQSLSTWMRRLTVDRDRPWVSGDGKKWFFLYHDWTKIDFF